MESDSVFMSLGHLPHCQRSRPRRCKRHQKTPLSQLPLNGETLSLSRQTTSRLLGFRVKSVRASSTVRQYGTCFSAAATY